MDEKRIIVVDYYPVIRKGLIEVIRQEKDMVVCSETASTQNIHDLIREHQPNLLILDPALKEGSGIECIKDLKSNFPAVLIMAFSSNIDTIYVDFVLKAGAIGYVLKSDPLPEIINAIQKVFTGDVFVSERIRVRLLKRLLAKPDREKETPLELLSSRELEVFQLMGEGFATKIIAKTLGLGIKTIETYKFNIKKKMGITDNTQLIQQAVRWANIIDRKV